MSARRQNGLGPLVPQRILNSLRVQLRCVVFYQPLSVDERMAFFEGSLESAADPVTFLIEHCFNVTLNDLLLATRQFGFDRFVSP
jgi:hypothetical protein